MNVLMNCVCASVNTSVCVNMVNLTRVCVCVCVAGEEPVLHGDEEGEDEEFFV